MKALPWLSITPSPETQTKIREHKNHHKTTRWFTPDIPYHHTITIIASTGRWYTIQSSRSPTCHHMSFSEGIFVWGPSTIAQIPNIYIHSKAVETNFRKKVTSITLNHINKDGCWRGSLKGAASAWRTGKLNWTEQLPLGAKYSLLVQTDSKKFSWLSSYPATTHS